MTDQSKAASTSRGVRTRSQIDNFEVWEEDGMIHTRESLRLKINILVYKKEDVPRDGNGYPKPETRWVKTLLGHGYGGF
jgi:hypothetical protein